MRSAKQETGRGLSETYGIHLPCKDFTRCDHAPTDLRTMEGNVGLSKTNIRLRQLTCNDLYPHATRLPEQGITCGPEQVRPVRSELPAEPVHGSSVTPPFYIYT